MKNRQKLHENVIFFLKICLFKKKKKICFTDFSWHFFNDQCIGGYPIPETSNQLSLALGSSNCGEYKDTMHFKSLVTKHRHETLCR